MFAFQNERSPTTIRITKVYLDSKTTMKVVALSVLLLVSLYILLSIVTLCLALSCSTAIYLWEIIVKNIHKSIHVVLIIEMIKAAYMFMYVLYLNSPIRILVGYYFYLKVILHSSPLYIFYHVCEIPKAFWIPQKQTKTHSTHCTGHKDCFQTSSETLLSVQQLAEELKRRGDSDYSKSSECVLSK